MYEGHEGLNEFQLQLVLLNILNLKEVAQDILAGLNLVNGLLTSFRTLRLMSLRRKHMRAMWNLADLS